MLEMDILDLDKLFGDGRSLLDFLDIFNFDCLIIKVIWKIKCFEIFIDLILINNKKKSLMFDVVDM